MLIWVFLVGNHLSTYTMAWVRTQDPIKTKNEFSVFSLVNISPRIRFMPFYFQFNSYFGHENGQILCLHQSPTQFMWWDYGTGMLMFYIFLTVVIYHSILTFPIWYRSIIWYFISSFVYYCKSLLRKRAKPIKISNVLDNSSPVLSS